MAVKLLCALLVLAALQANATGVQMGVKMLDLGDECLILSHCELNPADFRSNGARPGGGRRRQRPKPRRDRSIRRWPWCSVVFCIFQVPNECVCKQVTIWDSSVASSRCVTARRIVFEQTHTCYDAQMEDKARAHVGAMLNHESNHFNKISAEGTSYYCDCID